MMASVNAFFNDLRMSPEVIDPPKNESSVEGHDHGIDPIFPSPKSNVIVSSGVRELLECPVCLNAMYPPIHQV